MRNYCFMHEFSVTDFITQIVIDMNHVPSFGLVPQGFTKEVEMTTAMFCNFHETTNEKCQSLVGGRGQ